MIKVWFYNVVLKDKDGLVFLSQHKYMENNGGLAAIRENAEFVCYAMETGTWVSIDDSYF